MITLIQIMAITFFLAAIRMKFWKTSVNTFVVLGAIFIIAVASLMEIPACWINAHLSVLALTMTFLMARVVYQRYILIKKDSLDLKCNKSCEMNFMRRKDDKKFDL